MVRPSAIACAEVFVPCGDALDAAITFLVDQVGFRLDAIFPADAPRVAQLSGHGARLRLERGAVSGTGAPARLRLELPIALWPRGAGAGPGVAAEGREVVVPGGGLCLVFADAPPAIVDPGPLVSAWAVSRSGADATWVAGRAGMGYRDLVPDRQGGRFIASHIRIAAGGPVPDYVHFHEICFQLIFCVRGWVRVVYEDQGEPFVLQPGDAVLQPPRIRHRVLECSPGLEVVEVGSPAEHVTRVEHTLTLPTAERRPDHDFSGQHFVRHQASLSAWTRDASGLEAQELGIAAGTQGLCGARVLRRPGRAGPDEVDAAHGGELALRFVLAGGVTLRRPGAADVRLGPDGAVAVPPGQAARFVELSADASWLEVRAPARAPESRAARGADGASG